MSGFSSLEAGITSEGAKARLAAGSEEGTPELAVDVIM